MFVTVRYDKEQGFQIDENAALLIPELRDVLKDENLGGIAVAYIVMAADAESPLLDKFDTDELARKEAERWVLGEYQGDKKTITGNKKVKDAIKAYRVFSETPVTKLKRVYKNGLKKLGDSMESADPGDTKFITNLKALPDLIKSFENMDSMPATGEVQTSKAKVKGDRQVGYRALKNSRK